MPSRGREEGGGREGGRERKRRKKEKEKKGKSKAIGDPEVRSATTNKQTKRNLSEYL